jgi:hypothetical protein
MQESTISLRAVSEPLSMRGMKVARKYIVLAYHLYATDVGIQLLQWNIRVYLITMEC